MGYRSEVRSLIYGDADKVSALWTKHMLLDNAMLKMEGDHLRRYSSRLYNGLTISVIDLSADSWKWYEDYEHIQAWDKMLDDARDNFELEYEFLRVGEEPGDVESKSSADSMGFLFVRTQIVSDANIDDDYEEPLNQRSTDMKEQHNAEVTES